MPMGHPCLEVFACCVAAIQEQTLIQRESRQDKEFHFQNWFKARLADTKLNFEIGGRNAYPDFRLVASTDGFEVKGLAYPGREATTTATAKFRLAATTGAPFSTSSVATQPNRTATSIRCSTWWSLTATS